MSAIFVVCPSNTATCVCFDVSHNLTVLSKDPDARRLPELEYLVTYTAAVCPINSFRDENCPSLPRCRLSATKLEEPFNKSSVSGASRACVHHQPEVGIEIPRVFQRDADDWGGKREGV